MPWSGFLHPGFKTFCALTLNPHRHKHELTLAQSGPPPSTQDQSSGQRCLSKPHCPCSSFPPFGSRDQLSSLIPDPCPCACTATCLTQAGHPCAPRVLGAPSGLVLPHIHPLHPKAGHRSIPSLHRCIWGLCDKVLVGEGYRGDLCDPRGAQAGAGAE